MDKKDLERTIELRKLFKSCSIDDVDPAPSTDITPQGEDIFNIVVNNNLNFDIDLTEQPNFPKIS